MIDDRPRAADLAITDWDLAAHIARAQWLSLLEEVQALGPDEWDLPTDLPGWTVRDLVAHVAEVADTARSPLRLAGRILSGTGRRHGCLSGQGPARAVRAHHEQPIPELAAELRQAIDRARGPGRLAGLPLPFADLPRGATLGYLAGVLVPRDAYLHRLDIGRATGRHVPTDPTDSEVIAQVVRDLGRAWSGPPMILRLTGMSGGTWTVGDLVPGEEPPVALVPVTDFVRHVCGRPVRLDAFDHLPEDVLAALLGVRIGW